MKDHYARIKVFIGVFLAALVLAACNVRVASAAEGSVSVVQGDTLYVISSCPYCNGLSHGENDNTPVIYGGEHHSSSAIYSFQHAGYYLGEAANSWPGVRSVSCSDESLVSATVEEDGDLVLKTVSGTRTGTADVTLTSNDGTQVIVRVTVKNIYDDFDAYVDSNYQGDVAKANEQLDRYHYDEIQSVRITNPYQDEQLRSSDGPIWPRCTVSPDRGTIYDVSFQSSDPSVLSIGEDGACTVRKSGTVTVTATAVDRAHPDNKVSSSVKVEAIYDGGLSDPWVEAEDGGECLIPYSIDDGVMTFDGHPELGKWYRLDIETDDTISYTPFAPGIPLPSVVTPADLQGLQPGGDGFDKAWRSSPYWFREGESANTSCGIAFELPMGAQGITYTLVGEGSAVPMEVDPEYGVAELLVKLYGPAKLTVQSSTSSTAGTIVNDQGATLSFTPASDEEALSWNDLRLVTDLLDGGASQGAIDRVTATMPGVMDGAGVYDIHLIDKSGKTAELPGGKAVAVTLPLPKGMSADSLHVYHVADDGSVSDMEATVNAGANTVSFETEHFSTYVLANVNEEAAKPVPMYRLYNRWTGEHFYTASAEERDSLVKVGWTSEGTGWVAPTSGAPVYRLYNPYVEGGDHHYTMDEKEYEELAKLGWRQEGVGWYSGGDVPVYRQYNPFAVTGTHNYTTDKHENDELVRLGWRAEGTGWYAVSAQ